MDTSLVYAATELKRKKKKEKRKENMVVVGHKIKYRNEAVAGDQT